MYTYPLVPHIYDLFFGWLFFPPLFVTFWEGKLDESVSDSALRFLGKAPVEILARNVI